VARATGIGGAALTGAKEEEKSYFDERFVGFGGVSGMKLESDKKKTTDWMNSMMSQKEKEPKHENNLTETKKKDELSRHLRDSRSESPWGYCTRKGGGGLQSVSHLGSQTE